MAASLVEEFRTTSFESMKLEHENRDAAIVDAAHQNFRCRRAKTQMGIHAQTSRSVCEGMERLEEPVLSPDCRAMNSSLARREYHLPPKDVKPEESRHTNLENVMNVNLGNITNSFQDARLASLASLRLANEFTPHDRGGPY